MAAEILEREYRTKLCQLSAGDGRCRVESEVILPDYKEAAHRIVRVDTKARINRKNTYRQGQYLICEAEGVATFQLLYMTDRQGEKGCPSSFLNQESFSYLFKIPMQDETADPDKILTTLEVRAENTSYKLLGPRKLSMRSDVVLELDLKYGKEFSFFSDASASDMEGKRREENYAKLVAVHQEDFSFSETIELPKTYLPIAEVCDLDVTLFAERIRVEEGGVCFSGNASLWCNYVSQGEEELIGFFQPIEFEKHVGMEEIEKTDLVQITLFPNFLKGSTDVNQDGENKNLLFELGYTVEVRVFRNEKVSLLEDAFSFTHHVHCEKETLELESMVGTSDFSLSLRQEVSHEGRFLRVEGIRACVDFKNAYLNQGKVTVEGRLSFGFLGIDEGGEIVPGENFCDFSSDLTLENLFHIPANEECRIEILGGVRSLEIQPEEKKLQLRCDLFGCILVFCCKKVPVVSRLERGDEKEKRQKGLLYVYPEKNEALWDICKKYGVSQSAVDPENKLQGEAALPQVLRIIL